MATRLYGPEWVDETLQRLADEILADRAPGERRALVGLQTRGAVLAGRLQAILTSRGQETALGTLDATPYRDDLHTGAGLKAIQASDIPFDLNGCAAILCDDVVSTGRTIRAAMDALFAFGRPTSVRLLTMLDRGGRELPIQPDFTGARVDVPREGFVRLKLAETDPHGDAVFIVGPGEEEPAA